MTGEFDPKAYRDEYREALMAIIDAKAAGEEISEPAAAPAAKLTDLVAALEASVAAAKAARQAAPETIAAAVKAAGAAASEKSRKPTRWASRSWTSRPRPKSRQSAAASPPEPGPPADPPVGRITRRGRAPPLISAHERTPWPCSIFGSGRRASSCDCPQTTTCSAGARRPRRRRRRGPNLLFRAVARAPLPRLRAPVLQHWWASRGSWSPTNWTLGLAVVAGGQPMGVQDVTARDFAVRKTVVTGSWLGRAYQGRGYGTEMRAAVLTLAFDGWALTARSRAISRATLSRPGSRPSSDTSTTATRSIPSVASAWSNVASESAAKHGSAAWCRSRSKAWNRASSCSA